MNFRLTALVLFMFMGCRGWEAVLISSDDFVPMLNVTAVLSPDGGGEVTVLVQRLLPLDGPLTTDEVVYDTTWYIMHETGVSAYYVISRNRSRHEVMDAIVTLSDGSETYYLEYTEERRNNTRFRSITDYSRYVPQDTAFVPLPGDLHT
ncbi:MAG: hypothetical protein IID15_01510 [Candidatus Marinimicrobia bacterium]|nr:hypothetical protein [Candidatus Neomarinimicrobiota bacterium]